MASRTETLPIYTQELTRAKQVWDDSVGHEVDFWDGWISQRYNNEAAWNNLLDPNRHIEYWMSRYIDAPPGSEVKILDVGAGPLTGMPRKWNDRTVILRAVDPLADQYRAAIEKLGVVPPTWTERCDGERLTDLFPENEFDLVHAANCLDHSYDPIRVFRQIVSVLKPGCYGLLEHGQNEAVFEQYVGLHQWNFDEVDGEFVVWRPGCRVWVQEALRDACHVEVNLRDYQGPQKYVSVRLKKLRPGETPIPSRRPQADEAL